MDVLANLNVEAVPEQQTRTKHLIDEYPDFQFRLGFDACCTCGKRLETNGISVVVCPNCRRVKYCSDDCRQQDAAAHPAEIIAEEDSEEIGMGHTSIICSVLQTCNDDEDVEDGVNVEQMGLHRRQAALDRIQSEYESYPATLANGISEGPCFQSTLKLVNGQKSLVVHIIGASTDAELIMKDEVTLFRNYSEALSNLISLHSEIDRIELIFIGPECPDHNIEHSSAIVNDNKNENNCTLLVRTLQGIYSQEILDEANVCPPNIVVFFNPGFTVPEYEHWQHSLESIPKGTPFLLTTNTELEGIADCQFLLDQDKIQSLPPGLADIFGVYSPNDDEDNEDSNNLTFFSENPFSGTRVRQSGTMGNDIYVKNRWLLTGILDSFESVTTKKESQAKRMKTVSNNRNSKIANPALI